MGRDPDPRPLLGFLWGRMASGGRVSLGPVGFGHAAVTSVFVNSAPWNRRGSPDPKPSKAHRRSNRRNSDPRDDLPAPYFLHALLASSASSGVNGTISILPRTAR